MSKILDKGELELADFMGSDLAVVQGARISNGAAMPDWRGAPDEKLIRFLAKNGHMSPFEHAVFKFYVKCPIFVAREWQRHRTFSYNERSGRYKEFEPEFYVPDHLRSPDPNNKQGSVNFTGSESAETVFLYLLPRVYERQFDEYRYLLGNNVSREMARMVLPLSLYTEFIVTGNFRNWMHFLELRNTPDAQQEIRLYAEAISGILEEKMPISYAALEEFSGQTKS